MGLGTSVGQSMCRAALPCCGSRRQQPSRWVGSRAVVRLRLSRLSHSGVLGTCIRPCEGRHVAWYSARVYDRAKEGSEVEQARRYEDARVA